MMRRDDNRAGRPYMIAMTRIQGAALSDLLDGALPPAAEPLADGAVRLRGFAAADAPMLVAAVDAVAATAPFRRMATPSGHVMSVAMTNCGAAGWITDRRGYRYE